MRAFRRMMEEFTESNGRFKFFLGTPERFEAKLGYEITVGHRDGIDDEDDFDVEEDSGDRQ